MVPRAQTRRIVGTYAITGNQEQARVTISKRLDDYDFPNQVGDELRVEYVETDDGNKLEIFPVEDPST